MLKKFLCIPFLIIFTAICYADNSYVIDFSKPQKYIYSLNKIRSDLGRPLGNIIVPGSDARVFQLNASDNPRSRNGVIIAIRGVRYYNDPDMLPVQFVINPANLYVAGFIARNVYYRFSDTGNINVPGVRTVDINNDSSYLSLERVAQQNRLGMNVSRQTLVQAYISLDRFTGNNLSQASARALLQYITIIPEALRFRQIQRNIRVVLDKSPRNYIMPKTDIALTLNWGSLSALLPSFNSLGATGVRTGNIYLPDASAIMATMALILNCNSRSLASK